MWWKTEKFQILINDYDYDNRVGADFKFSSGFWQHTILLFTIKKQQEHFKVNSVYDIQGAILKSILV